MKRFTSYCFLFFNSFLALAGLEPSNSTVTFLENKGQWRPEILYEGVSSNIHFYLLKNGFSFCQTDENYRNHSNPAPSTLLVWNMKFVNPDSKVEIKGYDGKSSVASYLKGNDPSNWVIHPKVFKAVHYNNLYEKIDLNIYGVGMDLKYDYIMHPGGNLSSIQTYYEGIKKLSVNSSGDLLITTSLNTQVQKVPVAWQVINGTKHSVVVNYLVLNDSTFAFEAKSGYDKNYDLVIDPLFQMVWASYTQAIGISNNINYCFGSTLDKDGNVYLTGMVDGTFPITPGAYSGPGNVVPEIFVAKFTSDGTTMLYSTYLQGNSSEFGVAIAADDSGRAYITGIVDLNITGVQTYPSTSNAYQPVHNAGSDAMLTVLNADGTGLVYSSFLGGTGGEGGNGVVLGGPGIAYVVGATSTGNFPVKAAPVFPSGSSDLFVAKFDINQSGNNSLIYSVRIGGGGSSYCSGRGIALDDSGNVYVTGSIGTGSSTVNFPTTPGAYTNVYNPGIDGYMSFVTKISATTPVSLVYSTLLAPGITSGIALHKPSGDVVVVGTTFTFAFPVTAGALQPVHAGVNLTDAYAIRLNSLGSSLVYSTFLGGIVMDVGSGVAVNSNGEAYVVGISQDSFPTSPGAYQPSNAGSYDFFVVNLNASGTGYACGGSTYVGGSDADYSGSFYDFPSPRVTLIDNGGNNDTILVTSTSHSQDFPTTPGVYGPVKVNGIADQPVFFKMTCATSVVNPVVNFSTAVQTACGGATVNFTDLTSNNPTSWQWSFPGGTPATSNLQNPQGIIFSSSGLYNIELVACNAAGCDSIEIPLQLTIPQNVVVNLGNDTIICNGNSIQLSANPGMTNYNWLLNGVSFAGNVPSVTANQQGSYVVNVTDSNGCIGIDTLNLIVSAPVVSLGNDIHLCNDDSVLLSASTGYSNYEWFNAGIALPATGNSIYVSQQGLYSLLVTDSVGCTNSDTLLISESTVVLNLIGDTSFCSGNSILVDAGSNFSSYQWTLDGNIIATTDTITILQTGNYFLTVTDSFSCSANDNVQVTVNELPDIQAGNDVSICENASVTLSVTGGNTWLWNPSAYLSSATSSTPISTPVSNITYTVTGIDLNGCSGTDEITISVEEAPVAGFNYTSGYSCAGVEMITENTSENAGTYLWDFGDGYTSTELNPVHMFNSLEPQSVELIAYNGVCSDTFLVSNITFQIPQLGDVPNVFTPNSDGKNDCFIIPGVEVLSACYSIKVFSRWGIQVYESENTNICWDGNSDSDNALPDGIYYYIIKLKDIEYNGIVRLIR